VLHKNPDMPGDFTDLRVWKASLDLVRETAAAARLTRGLAAKSAAEQMVRAAESISANIAEGYGRGLGADFARFLRVACASSAELESHLHVALASGRLPAARAEPLIAQARAVRAMLGGLARSVVTRSSR
jgi:four helix bundle protein